MDKFYSLLIIFSTAFTAKAQIPVPASPATVNASNCTTTPNIDVCPPSGNNVIGTHRNGVYNRGNTANNRGATSVRFPSSRSTSVDFKIVDISGKTVLQQTNNVAEGNNSVTVSYPDKLNPGLYFLQMINDGESAGIKFSAAR